MVGQKDRILQINAMYKNTKSKQKGYSNFTVQNKIKNKISKCTLVYGMNNKSQVREAGYTFAQERLFL